MSKSTLKLPEDPPVSADVGGGEFFPIPEFYPFEINSQLEVRSHITLEVLPGFKFRDKLFYSLRNSAGDRPIRVAAVTLWERARNTSTRREFLRRANTDPVKVLQNAVLEIIGSCLGQVKNPTLEKVSFKERVELAKFTKEMLGEYKREGKVRSLDDIRKNFWSQRKGKQVTGGAISHTDCDGSASGDGDSSP